MKKYEIIDVHAHIFPEKIREKAVYSIGAFYDYYGMNCEGSSDNLIKEMDAACIDRAVIHSVATVPHQVKPINDFILRTFQKHGNRLIPFATIHPEMENMEEEIERVISLGFKGIKIHPDFQSVNIDAPSTKLMFKIIDGRVPVLIHIGDKTRPFSHPKRLAAVAEEFPNQILIGAHFAGYQAWDDAEKYVLGKFDNVYIDTSSSLFCIPPSRALNMIKKHGVERVVFGTDYPMWEPKEEIERFMDIALTEEERKLIFSENLLRILK